MSLPWLFFAPNHIFPMGIVRRKQLDEGGFPSKLRNYFKVQLITKHSQKDTSASQIALTENTPPEQYVYTFFRCIIQRFLSSSWLPGSALFFWLCMTPEPEFSVAKPDLRYALARSHSFRGPVAQRPLPGAAQQRHREPRAKVLLLVLCFQVKFYDCQFRGRKCEHFEFK